MKVPTLFLRDPGTQRVIDEVRPGCEWVLAEEGVPTRMYDGIGLFYGSQPGVPLDWYRVTYPEDDAVVYTQARALRERIVTAVGDARFMRVGPYELCGPGINNNPEGLNGPALFFIPGLPEVPNVPRGYDTLSDFMGRWPHEGIVWHHPDGRMAKLRVTDFPR